MSSAISGYTIGSDLKFDPDMLFDGQSFVAVGDSPIVSTNSVLLGKTNGALEIVGRVKTAITVENTKAITLTLEHDDNAAFTSAVSVAAYTKTASGNETLAADTELFRYVVTTEDELYWRVCLVSTNVAASGTIDCYTTLIG